MLFGCSSKSVGVGLDCATLRRSVGDSDTKATLQLRYAVCGAI